MAQEAAIAEDLRAKLISEPDVILEDRDLMRALVAANERAMGGNIVDLRGIAMERLEARLERLEDTHRNVIAAAYENIAGTNMIHRAVLRLLEPDDFEEFMLMIDRDIGDIMRVDSVRLVLETMQDQSAPILKRLGRVLRTAEPGFVDDYTGARRSSKSRRVVLRQYQPMNDLIYGDGAQYIRSEACLRLDLGPGRLPGLLLLGSEDPHQFNASMGTDLLGFFGATFERTMRRWLA